MPNNITTKEIIKLAITKYNATGNIGILPEKNSEIGLAICYLYLYKNEGDEKYMNELYKLINLQIKNFNQHSNPNLTLGYGLTSLAWLIELILSSSIPIDCVEKWIKDIDTILINQYTLMLENNNFDYFEGASGLLFYFLTKTKKMRSVNILVDRFLSSLESSKNKTNSYYYQDFKDPSQLCLNMGVPHGIIGIILTLLIIKEKKIECNIDETLFHFTKVMMSYEIKNKEIPFHFPSTILSSGEARPTRLAWCYGDIMAGYALYKLGVLYNNHFYYNHGLEVLRHTTFRKNQLLGNQNLSLCHGYPAIICIYDEMYTRTHDNLFLSSANYYRDIAHKELKNICKEQEHLNKLPNSIFDNFSLFYGLPGLVLTLLDSKKNSIKWKKILLI